MINDFIFSNNHKCILLGYFFWAGGGQIRCIMGHVQMANKEDSVSNLSKCKCKGCMFNYFPILFGYTATNF